MTTWQPNFVQKYSIILFCILALVIGTGIVCLVLWRKLPVELALASVLSASIAGVLMTAVEDGRAGLKLMLSRLFIWRVGIGYWAFAILFLIPAILLGSLFNPLFNGDSISISNLKPTFNILPMFFTFLIVSGLGQELGWTGYLTPRLQFRFNALTACIFRAVIGGIWHLPLFILSKYQPAALADFQYAGWIAQKGFLVAFMAAIVMFLVPWSIFFTWIFNNTRGSLLLVAILHGSEIWVPYWMMRFGIDPGNLDNYWGYGAIMIMVAIIVVITMGPRNLSRKNKRIIHQLSTSQET